MPAPTPAQCRSEAHARRCPSHCHVLVHLFRIPSAVHRHYHAMPMRCVRISQVATMPCPCHAHDVRVRFPRLAQALPMQFPCHAHAVPRNVRCRPHRNSCSARAVPNPFPGPGRPRPIPCHVPKPCYILFPRPCLCHAAATHIHVPAFSKDFCKDVNVPCPCHGFAKHLTRKPKSWTCVGW